MTRLLCVSAGLLVLAGAGLLFAADDKVPAIADIMAAAHKKDKLRDQIKAGLEKDSPDWPAIQKKTKEFVDLASALPKNEPPKGDKKSWKELSTEYVELVKSLDKAAGGKDAKAALAVNTKMGARCSACHKLHRE